jgi:hypothetical protein
MSSCGKETDGGSGLMGEHVHDFRNHEGIHFCDCGQLSPKELADTIDPTLDLLERLRYDNDPSTDPRPYAYVKRDWEQVDAILRQNGRLA